MNLTVESKSVSAQVNNSSFESYCPYDDDDDDDDGDNNDSKYNVMMIIIK